MNLSNRSQSADWALERKNSQVWDINDFNMGRIVGKGTFGKVVISQHKATGAVFALKCIKKEKIYIRTTYEMLKSERTVLSMLSSPFAVNFYGSFQDSNYIYLLQEYIPGGELFRYLQSRRKLTVQQARFYAAEIVSFFNHLHGLGIVYRDLKPENVLISASGHIKLVDFGFAAHMKDVEKSYTFCGTLEYLAPEMIGRAGHDFSVDWWTLGVLLFELLTGNTPFHSKNTTQLFDIIAKREVEFPERFDHDAKDLIAKLLTKDPKMRINGSDVQSHQFFKDIEWSSVEKLELQPVYTPCIRNGMDTSNYENYQDSPVGSGRHTHFSFAGF